MENTGALGGLASLELLDQVFLHTADNAADTPILLALDTESSQRGRLSELGISTFDPLCLRSKDSNRDSLNSMISTFYYAKAGSKGRINYKPYRLGRPQPRLRNIDLPRILDTHFRPLEPNGKQRTIILIGSNVVSDLQSIEECSGINFCKAYGSNITAIVDTQAIAPLVLATKHTSLKNILRLMELDFIGLHNAGHDSRYTLRAALMLFVLYKRQNDIELWTEQTNNMVSLIESIARCHKVNDRRTWTTPTRSRPGPAPDIFSQDTEEGELLALLA